LFSIFYYEKFGQFFLTKFRLWLKMLRLHRLRNTVLFIKVWEVESVKWEQELKFREAESRHKEDALKLREEAGRLHELKDRKGEEVSQPKEEKDMAKVSQPQKDTDTVGQNQEEEDMGEASRPLKEEDVQAKLREEVVEVSQPLEEEEREDCQSEVGGHHAFIDFVAALIVTVPVPYSSFFCLPVFVCFGGTLETKDAHVSNPGVLSVSVSVRIRIRKAEPDIE
jgi:hypothetical protein